jgi:hypothetical protein
MTTADTTKWFAAILGAVLVLVGLLGFIGNPIVGEPGSNPLFVTGTVHNIVHLLTGAAALYIAFGMSAAQRPMGLIGLGVAYGAVLVLTLVSGNLFGLLGNDAYKVNTMDHVLHAVLAAASIAVGYWARGAMDRTGSRRAA